MYGQIENWFEVVGVTDFVKEPGQYPFAQTH